MRCGVEDILFRNGAVFDGARFPPGQCLRLESAPAAYTSAVPG